MISVDLTEHEFFLVRRALNALRTRQELNSLSCSDRQAVVFKDTVEDIRTLENKLKRKEAN
jgi:hypothetical protein